MSYIVMECHPAYVILMDENSNFVKAANLHYSVGQTVTDPILMEPTAEKAKPNIRVIIGTIAAAAACLAIASVGGYQYYAKNLKTESVVMISTEAQFKMGVNHKGEVVYIESEDAYGSEILKTYDGKGKDSMTVANELLEIEKAHGYLDEGDTFDMYISADDAESYDTLKSDFEKEISELNLNVHVQTLDAYDSADGHKPPKAGDGKPQPPKADDKPVSDADKPAPHENDAHDPSVQPPTVHDTPKHTEGNEPPQPKSDDVPALPSSEEDLPQPKENDDVPVAEPPAQPKEPPVKPEKQEAEPNAPVEKSEEGEEIVPPPVHPPKAEKPQPIEPPILPVPEQKTENLMLPQPQDTVMGNEADMEIFEVSAVEEMTEEPQIEKISEKIF